jgi:hypothetical protein
MQSPKRCVFRHRTQTSLHELFIPEKFEFYCRSAGAQIASSALLAKLTVNHFSVITIGRLTNSAGQSIRSSRFYPPNRAQSGHKGQNPPSFVTRIHPKVHVFSIHIAIRPRQNSTISPHKSIFAKS